MRPLIPHLLILSKGAAAPRGRRLQATGQWPAALRRPPGKLRPSGPEEHHVILSAGRPPPPRRRLRRRGGRGSRWGLSSARSTLLQARSGRGVLGWRRRGEEGAQDAARGGPVPPCPVTAAAAAAGTGPGPGAAARAAVAAAAAAGGAA